MIPGFRFLFAAIMLSMSLLVFGLGAAALLRSAHEEFASNPSWRAAPEVKFAQRTEATMPMLATLRLDVREEQKTQEETAAPAEPEVTSALATPAQASAIRPAQSSPPETAMPEATRPATAKAEVSFADCNPPSNEAAAISPQNASAEEPAAAAEPKYEARQKSGQESWQVSKIAAIATSEPSHRDDPQVSALPEQNAAEAAPPADAMSSDLASTKIATLGGPPVDIIQTPTKAKAGEAKPDQAQPDENALKKRAEARRAARHRRIAAARLAAQQAQLQLQAGPFLQPPVPAARAR